MKLTKAQIVDAIDGQVSLQRSEVTETVEILIEMIKQTLESGEDVMISSFGRFCVREKNERRGRNPATGNALTLKPRRVVTFKCSSKLREKVNGNRGKKR